MGVSDGPGLARVLGAARELAAAAGAGIRRTIAWLRTPHGARRAGQVALDLLALAITAALFLTLNRRFYNNEIGYDEGFFAWGGWLIKKGLVPYRDFLEFKPPMVFITHYFAQALFGFKDVGYRTFFTVVPLAGVLALQISLVARGIGRFFAAAMMMGFLLLYVSPAWHDTALSDCESIGVSYYMLGLACLLWEGRFIKVTTALGGAFLTACVLSKEPFSLVVGFTWLSMFWLRGGDAPSRESRKLFAKFSLLGVGIFIVALSIYMVPTGAMKGYLNLLFVGYRKIYRDPTSSYCVAFGAASANPPGGVLLDGWNRMRSSFLNEGVLGYLLPLALPGAVFTLRRSKALFAMMLLAFAGALAAPTMSRCMWTHYYLMSMAGVLFVLVVGADSMKRALQRAAPQMRRAVTVALLLLFGLHGWHDINRERTGRFARGPWSEPQAGLLEYIRTNTKPTDRIFTTGPPILYAQADRINAARESTYIDPILGSYDGATDAEKLRPIYQQLVKNKPKLVFLDPYLGEHKTRTTRALVTPFLTEFNYKKVNEQLYVRP